MSKAGSGQAHPIRRQPRARVPLMGVTSPCWQRADGLKQVRGCLVTIPKMHTEDIFQGSFPVMDKSYAIRLLMLFL